MHRRQALLLLVVITVLPALVSGSGGFSEVAGDRGIDVEVADDESAYLGLAVGANEGHVGGDPFPVLQLTDQFSGDLTLRSVSTGSSLIEVETETPTDIGETDPFAVEVSCETTGDETVRIAVVADGPGAYVSAEREVRTTCRQPEIRRVEFDGCGNVHIEADDAIYPLTVTKVTENPGTDGAAMTTVTIDSDGRVGPGQGGKLLAIEADGERYENENRCTEGGNGQAAGTGDE